MSNGRTISVRDAHIKTASVEIRSLTVSGKQVTMGVFRQLLRENIVSDDEPPTLRGVPWGTVNYFPKPCMDDHLHVVWQKGDELRRACVYPRPWTDTVAERDYEASLMWDWFDAMRDMRRENRRLGRDFSEAELKTAREWREWSEAYERLYASLKSLPQLFIAV